VETSNEAAAATAAPEAEDTVEISKAAEKKTYKMDAEAVEAMKADLNTNMDALKQMVTKLLDTQAGVGNVAMDNIHELLGRISEAGGIDQLSKSQAQELISEDGYWGVNQTSDRILNFAKALTGGDPEKIEEMKAAFQKGFEEAENLWGGKGKLPEISYQTYDKVMEGFEEWANPSGSSEVATETEA
jgi:hypothetical protein